MNRRNAMTDSKNVWETFTEEVEVAGHQLVDEINRLIAEGNVRKLQIRSKQGDIVLNIPLTAGAVAGGVFVLAAPWLAVIAAIAGVLASVKLEIVREATPEDQDAKTSEDAGAPTGSP
jgi:phage terminase large subunit-like protein